MVLRTLALFSLFLLSAGFYSGVNAEPEHIKPNQPYYADEFTMDGEIARLGEERNYEEVFKNYEYYEAIYDELKRPVIFRAYRRGEEAWSERYFYDPQGKLIKKEIVREGKPTETRRFDGL